jgi:hypothetical protein
MIRAAESRIALGARQSRAAVVMGGLQGWRKEGAGDGGLAGVHGTGEALSLDEGGEQIDPARAAHDPWIVA